MTTMVCRFTRNIKPCATILAVGAVIAMANMPAARADESHAKAIFKAMSDYLAAQKTLSMEIDTSLEIMTRENQKLSLASSGTLTLNRPDKVRVTREGGFANVELVYDGKTLTLLRKDEKTYAQAEEPGTIDHLVDVIRNKYRRAIPAADLLMSNPYEQLMPMVMNTKDLGSGVIRGVECDHLAFRTKDVDWQIWIAQGPRPYPCRYIITSSIMAGSPQYTIDVISWKTDNEVKADFSFQPPAGTRKVDAKQLPNMDELPEMFGKITGAQ